MKGLFIGGLWGLVSSEPVLSRSTREADTLEEQGSRRYWQLEDLMEFFNPTFDERKYWTYGCNCLMLGDRPMSDPGLGPPVDALDNVCKKYKDCLKCARETHGNECIGEFTKYRFNIDAFNRGKDICKDDAGSCGRSLCECDAMFAEAHTAHKHVFDIKYHMFWSIQGWEPKDNCPKSGGGPTDPQCCSSPSGPAVIYNALTHTCNADGTTSKSNY